MSRVRIALASTLAALALGCASSPFAASRDAESRRLEAERRLVAVEQQATKSRLDLERLERRVAELESTGGARASAPAPASSAPADRSAELAESAAPERAARTAIEETELGDEEPSGVAPASEQEDYDRALALLRAGQPAAAEAAFAAFLGAHPASDLADNAAFWIGEARLARGDHAAAIEAYRSAVERFPAGNKVPDALYKLGHTLALDGELDGARLIWRELAGRFPGTAAAERARERLDGP
jgi:tol-pal system protein YbgF